MHQHMLDFASLVYSANSLCAPCWGLKAFGVYLVFLTVKSMWVIYHTKHVDVPSSKH